MVKRNQRAFKLELGQKKTTNVGVHPTTFPNLIASFFIGKPGWLGHHDLFFAKFIIWTSIAKKTYLGLQRCKNTIKLYQCMHPPTPGHLLQKMATMTDIWTAIKTDIWTAATSVFIAIYFCQSVLKVIARTDSKNWQQPSTLIINVYIFFIYLARTFFVSRLFEEKWGDIVFGFPWCVVHGAWFRVYSRYLVSPTPTVFNHTSEI